MPQFQLVILGGYIVGKSALVLRYVCDEFLEEHDATIEDTYRKEETLEDTNETVILDILDATGQEEFQSLSMNSWIKMGQGFLLVYDITSKKSFDDIQKIHERIKAMKPNLKDVPCVIIGTKCDLTEARQVQSAEGKSLALQLGCAFFETSAKHTTNIRKAFLHVTKALRDIHTKTSANS